MGEWLKLGEVAVLFRVDEKTASRWCLTGKMPGAIRTPGGQWRIPRAAVEKILAGEQK